MVWLVFGVFILLVVVKSGLLFNRVVVVFINNADDATGTPLLGLTSTYETVSFGDLIRMASRRRRR